MNEQEIWKRVPDIDGTGAYSMFEASNLGRIRFAESTTAFPAGHIAKMVKVGEDGYLSVCTYKNKRKRRFRVNRLVALAFLPNPENKPCVDHIDGNKYNNSLSNLRWCTVAENNNNPITIQRRINSAKKSAVEQYSLFGEKIAKYGSLHEASRATKIPSINILKCARKDYQYKHAGGFQWRFVDDEEPVSSIVYRILQYESDGTLIGIFESCSEAARKIGVRKSSICNCVNGIWASCKGYVWRKKYYESAIRLGKEVDEMLDKLKIK